MFATFAFSSTITARTENTLIAPADKIPLDLINFFWGIKMKTKIKMGFIVAASILSMALSNCTFASNQVVCPSAAQLQAATYLLDTNMIFMDVEGFTLGNHTNFPQYVLVLSTPGSNAPALSSVTAPHNMYAKKLSRMKDTSYCTYAPYNKYDSKQPQLPMVVWIRTAASNAPEAMVQSLIAAHAKA